MAQRPVTERRKASDFPPELLKLFDFYVHGAIGRRAFLNGAQKFAVGGVTATALFRVVEANFGWGIQVPPDDKRVKAGRGDVALAQGDGAIGFSFGGGVVNQLAVRLGPDLAAGLPFYGAQPKAEDAARIKAPINAQYGQLDARITDGWPAFHNALTAAGVPHEGHIYKGAN